MSNSWYIRTKSWLSYKQKTGCPSCALQKRKGKKGNSTKKLTTEEFTKRAKQIHGDKYDYSLVDYKNARTKVKIICPEHGEFEQTPTAHLNNNQGCKKCYDKKQSLTTEQFIEKAKIIHGDKYDYSLVDYKNGKTKVKIICPNHGMFEQQPRAHLDVQGCPKCKMSHGEKIIMNYFNFKNINYEWQKSFDDLRGKNKQKLTFDFYLPREKLLIEYQGEQHYDEKAFGGHHNLDRQQERDFQKKEYAQKNNLNLLAIPYWEFDNIEKILEEKLC